MESTLRNLETDEHYGNVTPDTRREYSGDDITPDPAAPSPYFSPFHNVGYSPTEWTYGGTHQVLHQNFDDPSAIDAAYSCGNSGSQQQLGSPAGVFDHTDSMLATHGGQQQLQSTSVMFGPAPIMAGWGSGLIPQGPTQPRDLAAEYTAIPQFGDYDQDRQAKFSYPYLPPATSGYHFDSVPTNFGQHASLTGPVVTHSETQPPMALPIAPNVHPILPQQRQQNLLFRQPDGLFYNNLDSGMSSIPVPTWHCPANDASIPTTDAERQQWVLKLLTAINNTSDVYDKEGVAFKKHWNNSTYYPATDREILCWEILSMTEQLHLSGPSSLASFNQRFWNQAFNTANWTFQQRMEQIIELLTYSKARCETLLGGSGMHIVVGNPALLLAHTKGNWKQNEKRQAILQAGRGAKV